jgi:hypothetical protein
MVWLAIHGRYFCSRGHKEAIMETIELIKGEGLNVKVQDELTDYLSCNILFNRDK